MNSDNLWDLNVVGPVGRGRVFNFYFISFILLKWVFIIFIIFKGKLKGFPFSSVSATSLNEIFPFHFQTQWFPFHLKNRKKIKILPHSWVSSGYRSILLSLSLYQSFWESLGCSGSLNFVPPIQSSTQDYLYLAFWPPCCWNYSLTSSVNSKDTDLLLSLWVVMLSPLVSLPFLGVLQDSVLRLLLLPSIPPTFSLGNFMNPHTSLVYNLMPPKFGSPSEPSFPVLDIM